MRNVGAGIIGVLIGLVIGYAIGRFVKNEKIKSLYDYLDSAFKNLDNYVMAASALVVVISIILSAIGKLETFASTTINVFGTVVFSWLLTKKSSKAEFKEHEQDLAERAYRHINYLETASNSAYKILEEFQKEEGLEREVKLILSNAMNQIKYIQGGINTCKMDWIDMLSTEKQVKYLNENRPAEENHDYGTINVVVPEEPLNQEEA